MNFEELNINQSLKMAIKKKGFQNMTEIQEKAVPLLLSGKDVAGKAKTGTGKTAAFAIPLIQNIASGKSFSALVIVPTRELALQVKDEIASLALNSGLRVTAVFGGESLSRQAAMLARKPEIVVGTPGRIIDFLERNLLHFTNARFLVLDEADKMFDMGFREDINLIISFFPRNRQTMLFSATMPKEIFELANRHLKVDKQLVDVSEDESPVKEIEQFYVMVGQRQKVSALKSLLQKERNAKMLVFCRTKRTVDWLERQLFREGIRALAIHGGKNQNHRNRTIDQYKKSLAHVLIATDLVARGIHVDDIHYVINFDFPAQSESYLHRIGRTARQGKPGKAISFCQNVLEKDQLSRISSRSNSVIKEFPMHFSHSQESFYKKF